jgi:DNA-binding transcriptional LysR family regulator
VDLLVDTMALDLVRREADIAVRLVKPRQPSLVARRVAELPWGLYASESYLRRRGTPPPDLAGHDVIAYDAPVARAPGALWLAEHAARTKVVLRTNSIYGGIDGAAAGLGIAAIPVNLARDARLVRLLRPRESVTSPMYLVTHKDLARVPRVRTTLEALFRALERGGG